MPAIEYGSYYWCVLLNGGSEGQAHDSIHLHADDITIDDGSLIFKSTGRRPAGTGPNNSGSDSGGGNDNEKGKDGSRKKDMIYIAFAPGSWKMVYAAKLQDGSPASVEHWNKAQAEQPQSNSVPANAGASGYVPQGVV
jgi:hypothetical protein